jgi:hypothetical protein
MLSFIFCMLPVILVGLGQFVPRIDRSFARNRLQRQAWRGVAVVLSSLQ